MLNKFKRDADALSPVSQMRAVRAVALAHVVPNERVRVSAVATPGGPLLQSLFGRRECIAYQCELVVNPGMHKRELESSGCSPFYLEDGGVHALVQGYGGRVLVDVVEREHGEWTSETLPPHVREWLLDATASDEWEHSRHLRWSERRIEPGERVCVVGTAKLQVDESGGGDYRQSAELLTFDAADDKSPLAVSNDPTLLVTS